MKEIISGMTAQPDIKSNFLALEDKVQKLIHLYELLKEENLKLVAEKRHLVLELEEEKVKTSRLEEGYKNLKEIEKTSTRQSISNMKRKISDIIVEIDKNITMIEDK